jgi:hypothetical protein
MSGAKNTLAEATAKRNRVNPLKFERSFWLLLLPRDNLAHTITPMNPSFDGRENELIE